MGEVESHVEGEKGGVVKREKKRRRAVRGPSPCFEQPVLLVRNKGKVGMGVRTPEFPGLFPGG